MEQDHHQAKVASTATSAQDTAEDTDVDMELDVEDADMTSWAEAEFEEKCTYIVKDTPWEAGQSDGATATRAESSLPRNLAFRSSSHSKEVRQKHTHTHTHDSEVGHLEEVMCHHKTTYTCTHTHMLYCEECVGVRNAWSNICSQ